MQKATENQSSMVKNEQQVGIGFNIQQILKLLGPSMYRENVQDIGLKELFQNAFDAVKKVPHPQIDIITDTLTNSISVKDNGIGMSTDTVKNVFLTIGGTLKEHLAESERSGGFGIAKVQFFMTASKIEVVTVKDGVKTIFRSTQEELFDGKGLLTSEPTTDSNGTSVRLFYPKEHVRLSSYYHSYSIMKRVLILDNLKVTFNNTDVSHKLAIPANYTKFEFETSWGNIDLHLDFDRLTQDRYSCDMQVLSAGLYQFIWCKSEFKMNGVLSIKPKVAANDDMYPFNKEREGFKASVEKDIENLKNYIINMQDYIFSERTKARFAGLMDLDYVDIDKTLTDEEREAMRVKTVEKTIDRSAQISDEALAYLVTTFSGAITKEKKIDIKPQETAELNIEMKKIEGCKNKFHNNTDVNYLTVKGAFDYFQDYSSLVYDVAKEMMELKFNIPDNQVYGISIDKDYHGVCLKGEIHAVFVNPLSTDIECMTSFAHHFMDTTVHEMAHIEESGHYESFVSQMSLINKKLKMSGAYYVFEKKANVLWNRHKDVIVQLCQMFDTSTNVQESLN